MKISRFTELAVQAAEAVPLEGRVIADISEGRVPDDLGDNDHFLWLDVLETLVGHVIKDPEFVFDPGDSIIRGLTFKELFDLVENPRSPKPAKKFLD